MLTSIKFSFLGIAFVFFSGSAVGTSLKLAKVLSFDVRRAECDTSHKVPRNYCVILENTVQSDGNGNLYFLTANDYGFGYWGTHQTAEHREPELFSVNLHKETSSYVKLPLASLPVPSEIHRARISHFSQRTRNLLFEATSNTLFLNNVRLDLEGTTGVVGFDPNTWVQKFQHSDWKMPYDRVSQMTALDTVKGQMHIVDHDSCTAPACQSRVSTYRLEDFSLKSQATFDHYQRGKFRGFGFISSPDSTTLGLPILVAGTKIYSFVPSLAQFTQLLNPRDFHQNPYGYSAESVLAVDDENLIYANHTYHDSKAGLRVLRSFNLKKKEYNNINNVVSSRHQGLTHLKKRQQWFVAAREKVVLLGADFNELGAYAFPEESFTKKNYPKWAGTFEYKNGVGVAFRHPKARHTLKIYLFEL